MEKFLKIRPPPLEKILDPPMFKLPMFFLNLTNERKLQFSLTPYPEYHFLQLGTNHHSFFWLKPNTRTSKSLFTTPIKIGYRALYKKLKKKVDLDLFCSVSLPRNLVLTPTPTWRDLQLAQIISQSRSEAQFHVDTRDIVYPDPTRCPFGEWTV